jgi:hypothetical protein
MIRPLIAVSLLISALLALLIGTIRSQPPPPLPDPLLGDCATPCWIGIEPGITTNSQAVTRLRTIGGFQLPPECLGAQFETCTTFHGYSSSAPTAIDLSVQQGRVTQIRQYHPGFGIQVILAALGQPDSLLYQMHYDIGLTTFTLWFGYNQPKLGVYVTVRCPASYDLLMHIGVDWAALYAPDYQMPSLTFDPGEIRRALRRECSAF